jgi:hypothetical protein
MRPKDFEEYKKIKKELFEFLKISFPDGAPNFEKLEKTVDFFLIKVGMLTNKIKDLEDRLFNKDHLTELDKELIKNDNL